ncbi:MAG: glycosyl transferase family 2 [Phenylobacterium sp.]|nr:glycosyl transferase family 2 [Phenylobacterium sp.]
MIAVALGLGTAAVWAYVLTGRGFFWLARPRDAAAVTPPRTWPPVAVIVPARDEADVIAAAVASLLQQDYPGDVRVMVVDDDSTDDTAAIARDAAARLDVAGLDVLHGAPPPPGWTGKLWAMSQGVGRAARRDPKPVYLLFTDADIAHAPDNLRRLVSRAEAGGLSLTSLMVELHCTTWAERLLIPAFVMFFQMVYPFAWVNRPGRPLAAAAGGCMLVRRDALEAAGGLAAIRGALIDDCALAARMKRQGPIWLGHSRHARSLRPYRTVGEIGRMVSRSAFAQLDYSALRLAGTLAGLLVTFLLPPVLAIAGHGPARLAGLAAWGAMACAFQPTLALYRRSPLWGVALPLIGALYALFTVQSAVQVWRGRGGLWKGRAQALARPA